MMDHNSKTIAVDFDGTIVEHAYPKIGKEMLFAFATLKELQKKDTSLSFGPSVMVSSWMKLLSIVKRTALNFTP